MSFSLYIHIPFCAGVCGYCDFYSVPMRDDDFVNRYIDALACEWDCYIKNGIVKKSNINTIYIGGGTPSVLPIKLWKKFYDILLSKIDLSSVKEFSVECNPDSFTKDHAEFFSQIGVTRITFGVQSLNDDELKLCSRPHNAKTALDVLNDVEMLKPFKSIGADIIYALPNQTIETLNDTLAKILSIPHIKHLSAYELTIADGTPFWDMCNNTRDKNIKWADEDLCATMYYHIRDVCAAHGFEQYEVSNYARADFESLHNIAYWSHDQYIGLGAAAHSYVHPKRYSNIADVDEYVSRLLGKKTAICFEETLSPRDVSLEIIFLGLRNIKGIDEDEYFLKTGMVFETQERSEKLREFERAGYIIRKNKKIVPTSKGMLFSDRLARELIV